MPLTYNRYLKLDTLLQLQKLQSEPAEHDEMLFIIVHQTYELWFKQILHELDKLLPELQRGETWSSARTLRRILTILKTLVAQVDILETMTPVEFNQFRAFLATSSGFQSRQFRELEILCGVYSDQAIRIQQQIPKQYHRLRMRMNQPTLWQSFTAYLNKRGHKVTEPVAQQRSGVIYDPSPSTQKALTKILTEDGETGVIAELLIDFDEGMQEWRYRHMKMVERTIGDKPGTGGSAGVSYLKTTLNQNIFPDLWAVRALL